MLLSINPIYPGESGVPYEGTLEIRKAGAGWVTIADLDCHDTVGNNP
jgi:hypothetical protein